MVMMDGTDTLMRAIFGGKSEMTNSAFPTIDDLVADRKAERERSAKLRAALQEFTDAEEDYSITGDVPFLPDKFVAKATRLHNARRAAREVLEETK